MLTMKSIINYVKKSKLISKILMVLFCFFVVVFTVSYVRDIETKMALSDIPVILLIYSVFAMLFFVPAIVINQIGKICFEYDRDMTSKKSWIITLLLNLFFGNFGAHRFYVGKKITGMLYLFTFGVFGIGYVYDLIMLILVLFKDKSGATVVTKSFNTKIPFTKKAKDDVLAKTSNKEISTDSSDVIENKKVESAEVLFTDVSIDGFEEKSQVIPQISIESKQNICENKDNTLSNPKVEISFNFENSYHRNDFIEDMKRYENKKGKECAFVPFMQYYPSYDSMDKHQKDYYFYWRNEIRGGVYPKTDLSYIFLYVYELLSGVGYKNSSDGYNMLLNVWENYRTEFPKLDRCLFSWSIDYTWLHNLGFAMPNWENISLPYDDAIKNIIIEKYAEKLPLKLPFVLIDSLCDYSLVRSKFYNDGHQLLLNEAIPRVVALADAFLYKKTGKGIFTTYGSVKSKKQVHYIYQGANCKNANQRTEISVKDYINSPKLRNYINELVRLAENTLRELYSYRGKLRGVELDNETARLIQSFLKKEYSPKKADTPIKRTKVDLDFDSIKDLRNQSDAVRDALEVSESPCGNKELLTDLQAIKELLLQLPPYCRKVIDELKKNDWEIKCDYSTQASIEKINELSTKSVACDILVIENGFLILEDDYRDEFEYIYEHMNEFDETKKSDTANTRFNISVLSAELQELLKSLTLVQTEIVYIILLKNDVDALLDKIATEEMSMPEILIDEINDIASQYIGDILINTFSDEICILEQYYSELKNAIKQEEL